MLSLLKEIILDYQELALPTGVPRQLAIASVAGKATICMGVRRSGKSTLMLQVVKTLLDAGVSRRNILYLNFFDDRLHRLQHDNLDLILEAYFSLYPEKKHTEKVYCFFDGIQVVTGWESFVERLLRLEKCDVYITGSSAQMFSREMATQMRGRALSWELFPFSFREFLDYQGVPCDGAFSAKRRLTIQKAFETYWETGGFPEVAGLERRLRIKTHQEYFNAILFRDLVERHDIAHPRAVTDLAHWLVDHIGALYSINGLTGYLKSLGHKAPKSAVSDYLEWFEDAYVLFTVRIFDASLARANTNPKKIYCVDHALVTSVGSGILVNSGHLLESLVFMALRRVTTDIFYYKTRLGREVDFIAGRSGRSRLLIQVCESMADPQTRKREISALAEAMRELKHPHGIIVTRNEDEQLAVDSGQIEVLSAWRFLLNVSEFE
ncbi:MAG: ATP-binding protein [Candidatus Sericytochromatia bacterium]|nr:ATP-binding protein [Candidatus Sericytochromatia bacterium]